ncbi:MAG: lipase family alpha/beta hydrolase [Acutalibacteraceae bacterium]
MKNLKKLTCLLLSVIMIITGCGYVAAFAAEKQDIPIVFVQGQGQAIFDADGNKIYPDDIEFSDIIANKEIVDPILKNLALGMATNNWDPYCDSLYQVFEDIYKPLALDKNGEASDGSYVRFSPNNPWGKKSNYGIYDYYFAYDWRLDPVSNSEILAKYIDNIIAATGHKKVVLIGRCEGSAIVASYLAYHGKENKVDTCIMYVPTCTGMDIVGSLFSGRVKLDPKSVDKYASYYLNNNDPFAETDGLSEFLATLVSVLNQVYVLGMGTQVVEGIYDKVYQNLIPRILSISFGSYPGYWSMVSDEYYEDAKKLNFAGKEDEYAGMIEKIDNYHYNVQVKFDEIMTDLHNDGMKVAVIAKYGMNLLPIFDGSDVQADGIVEISHLSFGATSTRIGETFSKDYIAKANEQGKGQYISPDKAIDTSTCLFPDNTWIIKNLAHRDFPDSVDKLIYDIAHCKEEATVTTFEEYPQFLYYNEEDGSIIPADESQTDPSSSSGWTKDPFKLFMNFFRTLFKLITTLLTRK